MLKDFFILGIKRKLADKCKLYSPIIMSFPGTIKTPNWQILSKQEQLLTYFC